MDAPPELDSCFRRVVGFAAFTKEPTAAQVCEMLKRAVKRVGRAPKYTVTDQGVQFRSEYAGWCLRHGVQPRCGAVGKHGSIAIIGRFFLTMKDEATRRRLVPMRLQEMRRELVLLACGYNEHRPSQALRGRAPAEVYGAREPAAEQAIPAPKTGRDCDKRAELAVSHLEGRNHPPIVELRAAA